MPLVGCKCMCGSTPPVYCYATLSIFFEIVFSLAFWIF
uniref:Uncharacterized protein n=1 Tax=Anguilla anguilla TaxID=7936 RepID=A0A0E9QUJ6_ANGAN